MTTSATRTIGRNILIALGLTIFILAAPASGSACDNEIRIAPETLNLQSSGTVVTVHTDVPYSAVDVYTVYLSGVAIAAWKADDRGYFVAKFRMDDIKAIDGLILNDYNTFQLVAMTFDGDPICGEAEVMIIDRGPKADGSEHRRTTE
jgi:hypothetical protein